MIRNKMLPNRNWYVNKWGDYFLTKKIENFDLKNQNSTFFRA